MPQSEMASLILSPKQHQNQNKLANNQFNETIQQLTATNTKSAEHDDVILSSIAVISRYPREEDFQKCSRNRDSVDYSNINDNRFHNDAISQQHNYTSYSHNNLYNNPDSNCNIDWSFNDNNVDFNHCHVLYPQRINTDKLLFNYLSNCNDLPPTSICLLNIGNSHHFHHRLNNYKPTDSQESFCIDSQQLDSQSSSTSHDKSSSTTSCQSLQTSDNSSPIDQQQTHDYETVEISVNASLNYDSNVIDKNHSVNDKHLIVATVEKQPKQKTLFCLSASTPGNLHHSCDAARKITKGPKILKPSLSFSVNPYNLSVFKDPIGQMKVYQQNINYQPSKIRKNDCNDMTPNAMKLLELGRSINSLTSTSKSLQISDKSTQKREKNRLASRSCRLKKKAQHEAYKLKLYGLNVEHYLIGKVKNAINNFECDNLTQISLCQYYDHLLKNFYGRKLESALEMLDSGIELEYSTDCMVLVECRKLESTVEILDSGIEVESSTDFS
ncbi:hypothetical protein GJ496_003780 [Pomphorhynchus laevis]|nr:hypothetical protein GJ496_003780 [Pomphorhynchus laevis]